MTYHVLILEDNKMDAGLMEQYLKQSSHNFEVQWVDNGDDYEECLQNSEPDIIISDYRLKSYSGLDAIHYRNLHHEEIPIVIVSGTIGEEKAVKVIKEGATDFLIKNNIANRLDQTVTRALKETLEKEKRRKAELELKESEERFRMLFKHSIDGIIIGDPKGDGKVVMVNDAAAEMLGYTSDELQGKPLNKIVHKNKDNILKVLKERARNDFFRGEIEVVRKNGELLTVDVSSRILKLKNGELRSYSIIRDISNRIEAEQKLQESLKEKETLLMEIHHRVKNNLAVISGLMEMQVMETENQELQNILLDSQSRIKSIALTHELLYEQQNFSNIEYGANIRKLCESIGKTLNRDIDIIFDLDSIQLNINQALPISLILNELVTNAFRHAFSDTKQAEVKISLKKEDDTVHLLVKDNGKGIPEDFELEDSGSMGFTLVKILTKQLKGEIEIKSNGGSQFHLQFQKTQKKGSGSALMDDSNSAT